MVGFALLPWPASIAANRHTGRVSHADPPDVIVLSRHAEKPDPHTGSIGVDRLGRADAHSLSVRGWQRAGALAALLAHAPSPTHDALVKPQRVIATKPTKHARSRREVDTAAPIADRLGLRLVEDHGHGEIAALVAEVLGDPSPALVVWHHGEIPAVALALGADPDQLPHTWPDHRYDLLWVLTRSESHRGKYDVDVVPQRLLAGDTPT